jgi:hypothetical protein
MGQINNNGSGGQINGGAGYVIDRTNIQAAPKDTGGVRHKSLIGIPWRYALACIDDLGLILRAEVIWSKPNGLPESVTDRVRRSHEVWFHFTLQPRYFSAVDEIREEHKPGQSPAALSFAREGRETAPGQTMAPHRIGREAQGLNPLGKLPGSVWQIPTQPLRVPAHLGVDHFAAFPMAFPRRIIQGWSPRGICSDCGFLLGSSYDYGMLGVRPGLRASDSQRRASDQVLQQALLEPEQRTQQALDDVSTAHHSGLCRGLESDASDGAEVGLHDGAPACDGAASWARARGERSCAPQERSEDGQQDRELGVAGQDRARSTAEARTQAVRMPPLRRHDSDLRLTQPCPNCGGSSFRPSVVADVFGGTGTVALVAKAFGRQGISVDMSADYNRLATWRTNDPDQLAQAMQVDKPARQVNGQADLFDLIEGEAS